MSATVEPLLQEAQQAWEQLESAFHDAAECFLSDSADEQILLNVPGSDQLMSMSLVFQPASFVLSQHRWPSEQQMLTWRHQFVQAKLAHHDLDEALISQRLEHI